MKTILIRTIPHESHRYDTVGDYHDDNGVEAIKVSDMKNYDYEFLTTIHELIEWYLTEKRGIKEEDITAFDKEFEKKRKPGNTDEPGDSLAALYYHEHQFATLMERLIAYELKVDWDLYNTTVENL